MDHVYALIWDKLRDSIRHCATLVLGLRGAIGEPLRSAETPAHQQSKRAHAPIPLTTKIIFFVGSL